MPTPRKISQASAIKTVHQVEAYAKELVRRCAPHLDLVEEHQPYYDMWSNIAKCAKERWEALRYETDPDLLRRQQGELDSLNCALYMSSLKRKQRDMTPVNPQELIQEIETYVQSLLIK